MSKKGMNFITASLQERGIEDRLRFAVEFAYADLSKISERQLNNLRQRFAEFLGFVETESYGSGYAGVEKVAGMDVDFDMEKEPEEYGLTDFVRLQDKIKPVLKGVSQHNENDVRRASQSFEKIRFSIYAGSLSVNAADADDAFLVTLFLLLNNPQYAKRIWDCANCGNPFFKTKRQIYCESCKTLVDRERVKKWRKKRANKIKEAARAARRRIKMRSNK